MGVKNERCPLQAECERKCDFKGHELDCDYYDVNGYGSSGIEDQEEIRSKREREQTRQWEESMMEEDGEDEDAVFLAADIGLPGAVDPDTEGHIRTLTDEILELKKTAGESIIGIGKRLKEVKAILPHGEWMPWLAEKVEFSERTAQNFMRISEAYENPQALADLGATKALQLLALNPVERERFIAVSHTVNGQEKTVSEMSSRELEKAIRERDEARKEAEDAKQGQVKMQTDMATQKELLERSRGELAQMESAAAALEAELAAMKAKPVDVAVMAVDQAALDKARSDAIAEMQAKLDKAVEARKKAEDKRKAAEEALDGAKAAATGEFQERMQATEAELAATRRQLEEAVRAEKRAVIAGDSDLAVFKALFDSAQETVNKMLNLQLKAGQREDKEPAEKMRKALDALSDAIRKGAA